MQHMTNIISPRAKPPRVSVPVSADVLVIFERLAKAGNMSTGRAIAEWLSDTVEAAELMASTMERARAAPKIVTAELHAMMLGMVDVTKELSDKYAKFKAPLAGERDGGDGKRSAGAAAGSPAPIPPSCNTGGKLPQTRKTKPKPNPDIPPLAASIQAYAEKNGIPLKARK